MRHPLSKLSAVLMHAALAAAAGLASLPGHAADGAESLTYTNITKIRDGMGARGDLAPIARIVSPLADSQIVPGEGRIGAGSVNGTGFVLNIEVVTRDATPIAAAPPRRATRATRTGAGARGPRARHIGARRGIYAPLHGRAAGSGDRGAGGARGACICVFRTDR